MTTSPAIEVVPWLGAETIAMLACTPVIEADRSMAVPLLFHGTATPDRSAATGAAGVATVRVTVATFDVPPGPVAVQVKASAP